MFECEKYHGCGNDFIICEYQDNINYSTIAKKVCNRYIGIGADTLIVIDKNNYKVWFYNADGTEAPMCGNGIRCAVAYLKNKHYVNQKTIDINTFSGVRKVYYLDNNLYKINMGQPSYKKEDIDLKFDNDEMFDYEYMYKDKKYNLNAIFLTTHHLVIVVDSLNINDEIGKFFCEHPMFKKGINVDFVQIINETKIKLRTYERGCGWTKACGSGATSSVAVLNRKGLIKDQVEVVFEYGSIYISKENNDFYMSGPAELIASNICFNQFEFNSYIRNYSVMLHCSFLYFCYIIIDKII